MKKYYGTFNFNGELIHLWTHAINKNEAKRRFIIRLSEKLNRTSDSIRKYFSDDKPNYEIKEIGI